MQNFILSEIIKLRKTEFLQKEQTVIIRRNEHNIHVKI